MFRGFVAGLLATIVVALVGGYIDTGEVEHHVKSSTSDFAFFRSGVS